MLSELRLILYRATCYAWCRALTNIKNCLVHSKLEFVDDADVRDPSDDKWREEVDDAGDQHIGRVRCSGIAANLGE